MVGRRLSQEKAKRLLAKAENEGAAPFPLPKLAQRRALTLLLHVQRKHRELIVVGPVRHQQVGIVDFGPVPDEFERHVVLDQIDGARAPHGDHVDLAVADELLRLRSLAPPCFDMRLELAHLAEGAVDIHGIELVGRHAIGQQREREAAERAVVEATAAGEFLDVTEVGPALRSPVRELVLAVHQIGAERIAGDAVVAHHVREHACFK